MQTKRPFAMSTIILLIAMPMAAQERGGQRGAAPAASGPAMTMTIPGFPDGGQFPVKYSQAAEGAAPGEGTVTGDQLGQSAGRHAVVRAQHARHGRRPQQDNGRSGALGRLEYSGDGDRPARRRAKGLSIAGRQLSDQRHRVRSIAVRAQPATGPPHHYMFELYALDTKLDVQPTADAFETRANVMKAMQGHILGKAVYGGLFRRPK